MIEEQGPFRLIVIHLPWKEIRSETDATTLIRAAKTEDGYPAFRLNRTGCLVWLWTPPPRLPDALRIAEELGLEYVTNRAWVRASPVSDEMASLLGTAVGLPARESTRLWSLVERGVWVLERFGGGHFVRSAHEHAVLLSSGGAALQTEDAHEMAILLRHGTVRSRDRAVSSVLPSPRPTEGYPLEFYSQALSMSGATRALCMFGNNKPRGFCYAPLPEER